MIILLSQCFPPRIGGIESVMAALADTLTTNGEEVLVITDSKGDWKNERNYDTGQAYKVVRYGGLKPLRNLRKKLKLRETLRKNAVKAMFTDSWKSNRILSANQSIPVFCFAHGNEVLPRPDSPKKERVIQQNLSRATKIIAVSEATAQLLDHFRVPPEKCEVIYNLVPLPSGISGISEQETSEISKNKGNPTLITLGRIEPRKGHDQVIRCLPVLKETFPGICYWIVGDGNDRKRLEHLSEELHVQDRIVFWGRVSEAFKLNLLKEADLMVMPNRLEKQNRSIEGFGLVFIEAAYQQLPVIAGRSGGAIEAVLDQETGLLCNGDNTDDVLNTITYFLNNPENMRDLSRNSYHRAIQQHHPDNVFRKYKALWENHGTEAAPR